VEPAIRQLPGRSGEPFELEPELLGGEQALGAVPSLRIGGDQREGGEVVTDNSGGAVRVDHVGPITQPQQELTAGLRDPDLRHGVLREILLAPSRVEDSLEGRLTEAQFSPEVIDREVLVRQQLGLDPMHVQQQAAPRVELSAQSAEQRFGAPFGDVAGRHLELTGQSGEHLGVRG
jgi:hypothetical protein